MNLTCYNAPANYLQPFILNHSISHELQHACIILQYIHYNIEVFRFQANAVVVMNYQIYPWHFEVLVQVLNYLLFKVHLHIAEHRLMMAPHRFVLQHVYFLQTIHPNHCLND